MHFRPQMHVHFLQCSQNGMVATNTPKEFNLQTKAISIHKQIVRDHVHVINNNRNSYFFVYYYYNIISIMYI